MSLIKRGFVTAAAAILQLVMSSPPVDVHAQAVGSLTGNVSSHQDGRMEGVIVTARREDANFAVSVVSDAQGQYSFPRTHLQPGRYVVKVRAVGYELPRSVPQVVVESTKTAQLDLVLAPAKDLVSQLTSIELAMSFPGPAGRVDELVHQRLSCAYCHTYNRIVKSTHSAEQFVAVINRMASYYPDGAASSDDGRGSWKLWSNDRFVKDSRWGLGIGTDQSVRPGIEKTELAAFLATINLSGGRTTQPYAFQRLPRPSGKATRVIVTQFDMPRKGSVPHEMELDSKGIPWYTDEAAPVLGTLDPQSGAFTEYPIPPVGTDSVLSTRDLVFDADDNVWFPLRMPGEGNVLAKFDVKTKQVIVAQDVRISQFLYAGGDGKIWGAQGAAFTRVDPKTMTVEARFDWTKAPNKPQDACCSYQGVVDTKGNAYMGANNHVIGLDGKTGTIQFWPIPTKQSLPRRGRIDSEGRYWFAEYIGDQIGMFDSRKETVQEWPLRKYSTPYVVSVPDRNGYVYSVSNMSERVIRLDPKTGEIVEYLMPTQFDSKKIAIHPNKDRTVVWMANTRAARLVRIEPLD